MTSETRQASLRNRIGVLEEQAEKSAKAQAELVEALNSAFGNMNNQLVEAVETVNALVASVGADEIARIVVEERHKKAVAEAEARKTTLKNMADSGLLVKADVISDKSVIVGQESDKEGKDLDPGYAQLQLSNLKPEFQAQVLGQAVGFVLDTPNGKVTVKEIWDFADPKPVPEVAPVVPAEGTPPTN